MLVFAFFISLIALLGSMLAERLVGGAIGVFLLLWMVQALSFARGPFPGVAAVTLLPSVLSLYRANTYIARGVATFFGIWVPMEFLTVLLYVLLGAWIVLMLVRNLKKERDQVRLLSRWQAVGFAVFLNVLFYALFDPGYLNSTAGGVPVLMPHDLSKVAVVFNAVIFLMIGLATLTPHEKLKAWWRRRAAGEEPYFSEYGLPWPWLVPSAVIAYGLLAGEAFGLRRVVSIHRWQLGAAAVQLLVFLMFTMRDILFLQWCALTRMKRPLVKGFLYLCLYYTADAIVAVVVGVLKSSWVGYVAALTPVYALGAGGETAIHAGSNAYNVPLDAPAIYIGLAIQIPLIFVLLHAISKRLRRPAYVPAMSSA
jgi:hypothetical protein